MKRYLVLVLTIIVITGNFMLGCTSKHEEKMGTPQEQTTEHQQETSITVSYTCPMHPDVVSDKPGECPKCGMDLVEKK